MIKIDTTLPLNNGTKLPLFGFGAYQLDDPQRGEAALLAAFEAGYRLIDTASIYKNESLVGNAWVESGLKREDIFITTKLWLNEQGETETPSAIERSLEKLQTDYVDLYLMHWPHPDSSRMQPCWEAMQKLLETGKCKAIGVSNFTSRRLSELLETSSVCPAVNQVEFNVFNQKQDLARDCRSKGIVLQSYSPLARCRKLDNPTLISIAEKHGKTPAQIMLRWCLEQGIPIIPKSSTPARIRENAALFDFEIAAEDMQLLKQLDEAYEVSDWKPDPGNWY